LGGRWEGKEMAKKSAGILLYRIRSGDVEVLLVHPGGPFWRGKDWSSWSIPKGEVAPGEDPLEAALREFKEETGHCPTREAMPLSPIKQKSGKLVMAWAIEEDWDPSQLRSNTFSMEWPPGSGKKNEFPEVDEARWFPVEEAMSRIIPAQKDLLKELLLKVKGNPGS
jgi:predicted NUDIX family NTP pyrophosphohydrolase